MRVAIFSDVHGNIIALERFLKAVKGSVDAYMCLGDIVDYGPWNDECLEMTRQLPNVTILEGNHERLFLGTEDVEHELPIVKDFIHHSRPSFSRVDLIADLPVSADMGGFHCLHNIQGRSIYPNTKVELDRDYLIGHTHHQFRIENSGFALVNPGSVGQNRKWINMADYAIMDTDTRDIKFHSVEYDVERFISELRARNYSAACVDYYSNKARKQPL